MEYFNIFIVLLLTIFTYKLNPYYYYTKWKKLHNLVQTTEKKKLMIIYITLTIIFQSLYLKFNQYMNNSIKQIDKKTYEINYELNSKIYTIIIKKKFGPPPVIKIINENNIELTGKILPYMGPGYDFHGTNLSPSFFGCEKLTFYLKNDVEHIFNKFDSIHHRHVDVTNDHMNHFFF